jgi:hypothetical protein
MTDQFTILEITSVDKLEHFGETLIQFTAELEEFYSNGEHPNSPMRLDWNGPGYAQELPLSWEQIQTLAKTNEGALIDILDDQHLHWEEMEPSDDEMLAAFGTKWHCGL